MPFHVAHHGLRALAVAFSVLGIGGCVAIAGYPSDPEDSAKVLDKLKPYFDPAMDEAYSALSDATQKKAKRDAIVLSRMRAYDIEFAKFEKGLWGAGNAVTLGGDLLALTLGGLATTVTNAAAKTGYAAAATGIIGANAAINRDLYYQRTLPALLAQMEANRAKVKLKLLAGVKKDDSQYSLSLAEVDLADLKNAGSMPEAVGDITQHATQDKQSAQAKVDALRIGLISGSDLAIRLRSWISPDNQVNRDRMLALQNWMSGDAADPALHDLPPEMLIDLDNPEMEADRARAISDLSVP